MNIPEVLRRIADDNDQAAFTTFFHVYHPKLLTFAQLFVSPQQAEDVVSDVLVTLLKQREKVFRMKKLEGYLFLCVKHRALNVLKKKSVRLAADECGPVAEPAVAPADDPLQQLLEAELRAWITEAVEALPPRRRMVYKLVKDEGLRYREVAELMDISERTVEHHLDAAVKGVRRVVSHYLSEKHPTPAKAKSA